MFPLTNRDVPGGAKDTVDQHREEGGVKSQHGAQRGQESICHTLYSKKKEMQLKTANAFVTFFAPMSSH